MRLSLKETNDQKIYFVSDLHLGHDKEFIWKARGYNSSLEHTNGVIDKINQVVNHNDILFCLGDFCLKTPVPKFEEYISRIQCQNIYMLWGNHYNPHYKQIYKPLVKSILGDNYQYDSEIYPLKYRNITYIGDYAEIVINGTFIILCHYPISVWNDMHHSAWMLCGHSHYSFEGSKASNTLQKILDVGWDGHYAPWSYSELASVMATKNVQAYDHHK